MSVVAMLCALVLSLLALSSLDASRNPGAYASKNKEE
jgi:hypothetical protein